MTSDRHRERTRAGPPPPPQDGIPRRCWRCRLPLPALARAHQRWCSQACRHEAQHLARAARTHGVPQMPRSRHGNPHGHAKRSQFEAAPGIDVPPNPMHEWPDYTPEQLEFAKAIDRERRRKGRHLRWAEVLAVALSLGYRKVADARQAEAVPPDQEQAPPA